MSCGKVYQVKHMSKAESSESVVGFERVPDRNRVGRTWKLPKTTIVNDATTRSGDMQRIVVVHDTLHYDNARET